jgi:hypothetical protein
VRSIKRFFPPERTYLTSIVRSTMSQQGTIRRLSAEDEEMFVTPKTSPAKKEVRKLGQGLLKHEITEDSLLLDVTRKVTRHNESINFTILGVQELKFVSHDTKVDNAMDSSLDCTADNSSIHC